MGFGANMPHLPGRPACLHDGQHPISSLRHPARVHDAGALSGGGECSCDHRGHGVAATEHLCGFVHPGGALLGEGAGFVLGVAGLQRCLLRQV
jgi:hypothetical protein